MRRWLGISLMAAAGAVADQLNAQPAPAPPSPLPLPVIGPDAGPSMLIVSCDPGGCWDEFGVRYDRADSGVFIRRDGHSCLSIKGRMHCE